MNNNNFQRVRQALKKLFFQEGAINTRCIFDIIGGVEGIKPVSQIVVGQEDLAKLKEFGEITGLCVAASPFKLIATARTLEGSLILEATNATDPPSEYIFVYISKDQSKIDAVIPIDAQTNDQKTEAEHRTSGHLFGYPDCCIDNYIKSFRLEPLHVQIENTPIVDSYYFYNNRFTALFNQHNLIPEMYPCSFTCEKSAKFAQALLEGARKYFSDFPSEVTDFIKRPILIIEQFAFQFLSYSTDPEIFRYNPGEVSAAGIPPDIAEIVRSSNKVQIDNDNLIFYRSDTPTKEIPIKENPIKEGGARLFIFNSDIE
ncbi:MAG: DUF483 domain-containing protein [Candidatus Poribacteria bacterium]|nr:DUF483 domain-containing protein [Candidatus Poribacteria bacterium]